MKIYTVNCELFGTFDHITPENVPGPKKEAGSSSFDIHFSGGKLTVKLGEGVSHLNLTHQPGAAPELVDQETSPWSKKGNFCFTQTLEETRAGNVSGSISYISEIYWL